LRLQDLRLADRQIIELRHERRHVLGSQVFVESFAARVGLNKDVLSRVGNAVDGVTKDSRFLLGALGDMSQPLSEFVFAAGGRGDYCHYNGGGHVETVVGWPQ